jgi:hypothetical protein
MTGLQKPGLRCGAARPKSEVLAQSVRWLLEKEKTMTDLLQTLRTHAAKRVAYLRTVNEIRAMPLDVALDLDIYRGDAERIARRAVYGR